MDESSQIEVPPSFAALYTSASGRLTEPLAKVCERYELCEDLANLLTEQASAMQAKTGRPEAELLQAIQTGLSETGAGINPAEGGWVVTRLAELLGWPADGA